VGLAIGDTTRYPEFWLSLIGTQAHLPKGTQLLINQGLSVVLNWNTICRKMTGDWLWMLGDDHLWPPEQLRNLLDWEVDVVVPLVWKRTPPFQLVIYSHQEADGGYVPIAAPDLPGEGLVEVHAAGTAGMLIRKHVLDAIGDPWFETAGEQQNEDLELCRKIREAGFKVHADVGQWMGHLTRTTLWPSRNTDGEWGLDLDFGQGHHIGCFESGIVFGRDDA